MNMIKYRELDGSEYKNYIDSQKVLTVWDKIDDFIQSHGAVLFWSFILFATMGIKFVENIGK